MAFQALELALDAIRHLAEPLAVIARRDPDLARHLRRAAASMALNRAIAPVLERCDRVLAITYTLTERVRA